MQRKIGLKNETAVLLNRNQRHGSFFAYDHSLYANLPSTVKLTLLLAKLTPLSTQLTPLDSAAQESEIVSISQF